MRRAPGSAIDAEQVADEPESAASLSTRALSRLVGRLRSVCAAHGEIVDQPIDRFARPAAQADIAATGAPDGDPRSDGELAASASAMLGTLVERIARTGSRAEIWLLFIGLAGCFPPEEDVLEFARRLELDGPARSSIWLLERAHDLAATVGSPLDELDIISDGLVVDVNYVAQHDLHTGIQRVARETLPRWAQTRDFTLAVWTVSQAAMRGLDPSESGRVLRWGLPVDETIPDSSERLIVPWRSTLFVPEILQYGPAPYLRALARFSGNRVVAVGYDCIPITSGEVVPDFGSEVFGKYLSALKYADAIVGISASATAEYAGFAQMLSAQGLPAPTVTECLLPVDAPEPTARRESRPGRPMVLCVGSHGPHKNHLAVLHAAERLWRDDFDFELRFVGGSGWMSEDFDDRIRSLRRARRTVSVLKQIPDAQLWECYQEARFTVFPSWHEGFGLPVAESLYYGTPAVTSNFGSMREIGEGGGTIMIDPRDDNQLHEAMRTLLADDSALDRLRAEALARKPRLWDDYAEELWAAVGGRTAPCEPDAESSAGQR
jgi:glycosyltransferase involved in cell wall biosynthesis